MKSILFHANQDKGLAQRLEAAQCFSLRFNSLINCVHVTPYSAFIMGDPFGGVYALPTVVAQVEEAEAADRNRIEGRLHQKRVRWEWQNYEGHPGHVLLQRSRLADLAIVRLPDADSSGPVSLAAGLALHARIPVLALPVEGQSFSSGGAALIAWNGSSESASAVRGALPLLKHASEVHIVTLGGDDLRFPQSEAIHYLLQHGIHAEAHTPVLGGTPVAKILLRTATELGVHYLVAGAYGHSRLRETIIGGVTRDLIARSRVPLLLAH